jgi:8-oxo-dGTP pyrophosphatase MutT (NUDIX family)
MSELDVEGMLPAIPAATLILFRDREGLPPEILMAERSKGMRFAGGAVVFPGGRVDDDDHLLAARFPELEEEDAAARIAAIRETLEESLIPVGLIGAWDDAWLALARDHLHGGKPFSALIDTYGITLDLGALTFFAWWRPNHPEARVFNTRFFIARAPDNLPPPVVDATENVATFWESAQGVIRLSEEDKVKVIFPTMRNLERLALFDSFDSALAHTQALTIKMISPFRADKEDGWHLCIPDDQGYPVTSENLGVAKTAFNL